MLIASLPPDAVRSTATWTLIVALLLLGFVVVVTLGFVLRRGRRLRAEAERKQPEPSPGDAVDPWQESGRRLTEENEDLIP